ncbi:HAD family hydrolase [Candidatus Synechococcus calcipolaris G9]|uniref:HAD family hydrolase n=1 Tax=Candidatus Synechococcus calcipolaris G9 TaxID=1497997 RepID=A0ABT6EW97_9SYNE|nr:HAD family hydrolase [Candidatus Synechococcus calcipolaris G9]
MRDRSDIYFADGHYSWGILEALRHYNF